MYNSNTNVEQVRETQAMLLLCCTRSDSFKSLADAPAEEGFIGPSASQRQNSFKLNSLRFFDLSSAGKSRSGSPSPNKQDDKKGGKCIQTVPRGRYDSQNVCKVKHEDMYRKNLFVFICRRELELERSIWYTISELGCVVCVGGKV